MSIYGPNFTLESMSVYHKPKTISLSGRIRRRDMGGAIPLINLSHDISLKIFWIGGGNYQPCFEFDEDPTHSEVIDSCFIFAERIRGGNSLYSVATKLQNRQFIHESNGPIVDTCRHVFSKSERIDPEFSFSNTPQQLECGISCNTPDSEMSFYKLPFSVLSKRRYFSIYIFVVLIK